MVMRKVWPSCSTVVVSRASILVSSMKEGQARACPGGLCGYRWRWRDFPHGLFVAVRTGRGSFDNLLQQFARLAVAPGRMLAGLVVQATGGFENLPRGKTVERGPWAKLK